MNILILNILEQVLIKRFSTISIDKLKAYKTYDLYKFYLLKDKNDDIQYSLCLPYNFSKDRTSPIIIINDHGEIAEMLIIILN